MPEKQITLDNTAEWDRYDALVEDLIGKARATGGRLDTAAIEYAMGQRDKQSLNFPTLVTHLVVTEHTRGRKPTREEIAKYDRMANEIDALIAAGKAALVRKPEFEDQVKAQCKAEGIDPSVLRAVMWSRYAAQPSAYEEDESGDEDDPGE